MWRSSMVSGLNFSGLYPSNLNNIFPMNMADNLSVLSKALGWDGS